MKDDKKYWINDIGRREWVHKKTGAQASRAYHWVDRVIFLEAKPSRTYTGETTFTEFSKDLSLWEPVKPKDWKKELKIIEMKNKKKTVSKIQTVEWFDEPEKQDYPAAISYLNLIFDYAISVRIVNELKDADITMFKAKDIFRASRLSLLGVSNSHVKKNIKKIKNGKKMSPILLVRDRTNGKVIIADGYHRLCGVYAECEDLDIPCKIVCSE